jgi:hypothetical protein
MKNAICALTRGYHSIEEYETLIKRNAYIFDNIYIKNPSIYDIILFHEGNITDDQQIYIQSRTSSMSIQFINVSEEFHESLNNKTGIFSKSLPQNQGFPFGYKCMCRFWSYGFLKYISDEYKYVIRIDEDCFIYDFPENLCESLNDKDIYFHTGKVCHNFDESENYAYGLKEFTNHFMVKNDIHISVNFTSVPYTNFCIMNAEYFKNCDLFKLWCKEIENEGGIFVSRWGDANIWGIYLSMANIDKKNFIEDDRIKYYHGTHFMLVN